MTSGGGVHFVKSSVHRLEPGPPAAVVLAPPVTSTWLPPMRTAATTPTTPDATGIAPPVRVSVRPSGEIALIVRMPLTPVIATGMPAARPELAALPAVNVTVVAVRLNVPPARNRLLTAPVEAKVGPVNARPPTSTV